MKTNPALSALNAVSPLDGRYASRCESLRPLLSEAGFMAHRVEVELAWLVGLSEAGLAELKPFSAKARTRLQAIVTNFSEADADRIKQIERVTNHDVKAVEYWLKEQVAGDVELEAAGEFIHFACTSEDINNTSHALMLGRARDQVIVPQLQKLLAAVQHIAHTEAAQPMLARTHGQPATPTTLGKSLPMWPRGCAMR
jgi:adenylosuccinate lyase